MPHQDPLPKRPKLQEALTVRDALAAALTSVGIQLPAMDVRTPWGDFAPDCGEQPAQDDIGVPASARHALVHLGVCSAPVALALAAVIAKGAAR
ncbi:hypothetical protein [Streptomyces sp. JNUCC 63]